MKKSNTQVHHANRLTDDEDNLPRALEMPSDVEEYDSNHEIQSSRDNVYNPPLVRNKSASSNKKPNITSSNSNVNVDGLRLKVTEQAQRLGGLETYKMLCEQRIRQLLPSHPIPVTEADLKTLPKDTKGKNLVQYYNSIIIEKDEEINILKKRIQNEKNEKSEKNEKNEKSNTNTNTNNTNKPHFNAFPENLDKLSNEKFKETYAKLHNYTNELYSEKEMILDSLRGETITNDEQRNYIEMLRQTIESSIFKHGLAPFLQNLRRDSLSSNNIPSDNVDCIIDISLLKGESEKYRKELVMSHVLITELKQEIEYLKKTNEDLAITKEKVKCSMESSNKEADEIRSQYRIITSDKELLEINHDELKSAHTKLMDDLYVANSSVNKYEGEILEMDRKFNDLQNQLQNQFALQDKLNEYKRSFEKLYLDFERTIKEKNMIEEENTELKEELRRLVNNFEDKETIHAGDKLNLLTENDELNRHSKKIQSMHNEVALNLNYKEKDYKKLEDKFAVTERHMISAQGNLTEVMREFEEYKKSTMKKMDSNEKMIRELNITAKDLKSSLQSVSDEKQGIYDDYLAIRNECERLDTDLRRYINECSNRERLHTKLNDQYQSLYKDFKYVEDENNLHKEDNEKLSVELKFWKEKYDKDINAKVNEINTLNRENHRYVEEINHFNHTQEEFQNEMGKLEVDLSSANSEVKSLQNIKDDLNRKIEKLNSDLQKGMALNYEITNANKNLNAKIETVEREYALLQDEKDKLEIQRKRTGVENEALRKVEKELGLKNYNLNSNLQELKTTIQSIHSLIRNFSSKFTHYIANIANNQLSLAPFSPIFIDNVKIQNSGRQTTTKEALKGAEEWIRTTGNELEIFYDTLKLNSDKLHDSTEKVIQLELQVRNLLINEENSLNNERILNTHLQEAVEQNGILKIDQENLEKHYEKISKELKLIQKESKNKYEEIGNLREKISNATNVNEGLNISIKEKEQQLSNASFQVDALEERIIILSREKKYLDNLLTRVSKSHPKSDVNRIVNEIMNLGDTLANLERDRVKIDDSLIKLDEEGEVRKNVRKEKEHMKTLAYEFDSKIGDTRNAIRIMENELKNVEVNEKSASNTLYEYELKIKSLQKEIDELKKRNLNSGNRTQLLDEDFPASGYDNQKFVNYTQQGRNLNYENYNEKSVETVNENKQENMNVIDRGERVDSQPSDYKFENFYLRRQKNNGNRSYLSSQSENY